MVNVHFHLALNRTELNKMITLITLVVAAVQPKSIYSLQQGIKSCKMLPFSHNLQPYTPTRTLKTTACSISLSCILCGGQRTEVYLGLLISVTLNPLNLTLTQFIALFYSPHSKRHFNLLWVFVSCPCYSTWVVRNVWAHAESLNITKTKRQIY